MEIGDITKDQILSKEDYWNLKKNRLSDIEFGVLSGLTASEAKKSAELRRILTFHDEYHELDKLFSDTTEVFDYLKSHKIKFFITTLRREKHLLLAIKQFKLNKYLDKSLMFCMPDEKRSEGDIYEKYNLLFTVAGKLSLNLQETWMVGDSDTDIYAARLAKYKKMVAIDRGIRSTEQLKMLKPDHIISNLKELLTYLT